MHRYLRAIGFASMNRRSEFEKLVQQVASEADKRAYTSMDEDAMLAVFSKEYAPGMGISICGEYNENNQFFFEYAYPYLEGQDITSTEDITVERHAEKESYAGVCDDARVEITIIFYLQNIISYLRAQNTDELPVKGTTVTMSGLSIQGTIVLPLQKSDLSKARADEAAENRTKLVEAARRGDEEAMETLTLDDMDTYTTLSRKILTTDVFSLVDTYFMPYGVECDQYSVLGEIKEVNMVTNSLTGENVYKMKLVCNDLPINVCINEQDLYGEPEVGRRFKGVIWLQGYINFPAE